MIEKVNPSHPDKVADRIAGAIVDLAYRTEHDPKIAVEVLIGHGRCHVIIETTAVLDEDAITDAINRIAGDVTPDIQIVPQDAHLSENQAEGLRCGDNGIFKGMPLTPEQKQLSAIARRIYEKYTSDGKYILDGIRLILCQSNAPTKELAKDYPGAEINPLGDWTGGTNVDTGATNRKLGSDMADSVTGGGLHGKDLSKADVSVNIHAFLKGKRGTTFSLSAASRSLPNGACIEVTAMAKTTTEMKLVSIDKLIPYVNNARTHSPEQINKLRSSLREFGFVNPVIIDQNYNVVAGHGRLMAAREEGFTEVPCVLVDYLTDAQRKAYILADNRYAEDAGWDEEMLRVEIEALQEQAFDLSLTGFDADELADLFADDEEETKDDDFDLTAALEKASFVEPGDLWTVGKHRLLCGDATKAEDVERLMDGKRANLIVTDPPYGVSFKSSSGLAIQNDSMKGDEFYQFLLAAFQAMADVLEKGGAAYVFHADTEGLNFRKAFIDAGFHLAGVCIWVKNSLVLGRSDYQWQHEPVLYGFLQNGKHPWYADRKQTTIWNYDKPKRNENHPTSKPLDLLAYPITNSSQVNSVVIDTFGGSGSTMMACEQTGRICYMMELDPKYASVILRRYVEDFGGADQVYVERDGKKLRYADLVKEVETRS